MKIKSTTHTIKCGQFGELTGRERGFKRQNVGVMTVMQISICEFSVISEDGPSLAGSPMT